MSELHAGQTVYAIAFHWPNGSTSWAALCDGHPSFAPAMDDDLTAIFPDLNEAAAFVGAYPVDVARFAAVESCTLRSLDEDEP